MIAMEMADENGLNAVEIKTRSPQLNLRSFATIHPEACDSQVDYLSRSIVMERGQGAATTQDVHSKRFHAVRLMLTFKGKNALFVLK